MLPVSLKTNMMKEYILNSNALQIFIRNNFERHKRQGKSLSPVTIETYSFFDSVHKRWDGSDEYLFPKYKVQHMFAFLNTHWS